MKLKRVHVLYYLQSRIRERMRLACSPFLFFYLLLCRIPHASHFYYTLFAVQLFLFGSDPVFVALKSLINRLLFYQLHLPWRSGTSYFPPGICLSQPDTRSLFRLHRCLFGMTLVSELLSIRAFPQSASRKREKGKYRATSLPAPQGFASTELKKANVNKHHRLEIFLSLFSHAVELCACLSLD
ncbi:hypothetical protein F4860DRAFT_102620 [Xylaria cubensis]|nr:hypothetical protein F4860DRAFT_102620 [Xylaria cubensis]